jgi:hypothetical protein
MNNRAVRVLDISVATSCREALQIVNDGQFDLVLSEFMLSDGTAYELMPSLQDTAATMFFSNAVEDGCWWMNAILKGQDRSHVPGMRPREFRVLLDKILFDKLSQNTNQLRNKSTNGGIGHAES